VASFGINVGELKTPASSGTGESLAAVDGLSETFLVEQVAVRDRILVVLGSGAIISAMGTMQTDVPKLY